MANITTNLGPVSAYLDAVAHGYTGTREEFGEYLAHVGDNAAAAAASAQRAAASESSAESSATAADESATAAAGSATAADGSATAAGNAQTAAEAAKIAAQTAQSGAETAQGAAEDAQGAAEDAQTAAEAAQAAAEAVLESIPEDYTTLSNDVGTLKTSAAYTDVCIESDSIPYATDGTASSTSGPKSFTQSGNIVTINGLSNATSTQGSTKLQGCGVCTLWTTTTAPEAAKVYPLLLRAGRIYRLSVRVLSGTRDKGAGSGNLTTRFIDSTETNVAQCVLGIDDSYASVDYSPEVDTQVTVRHLWGRLMTCTDLRLEVLFRDVTSESTVESEILPQIESLNEAVFTEVQNGLGWANGTISATLGENTANDSRIRSGYFSKSNGYAIHAKNGYTFALFFYDKTDGTYLGCMQGDGSIAKSSANLQFLSDYILDPQYKYRIGVKNAAGDTSIETADNVNIVFDRSIADTILSDETCNVGMFNRIGVCGYSWDSGYAYSNYTGTTHVYTRRSRSWGAVLANLYGIDFACYGVPSGTTCAPDSPWIGTSGAVCWQTAEYGLPKLLNETPCDLYWFHMFGNDWKKLGADYLGTIADITDDYTQNPDTFYGNYGRIIEQIKAHAPNALFIFSLRLPVSAEATQIAYAEALREIGAHYGIPVIDWHQDKWFDTWMTSAHFIESHPTYAGYAGMAKAADRLFGQCVSDNFEYFKGFVPAADPTE